MEKNSTDQKIRVFAYDTNGDPVIGAAAQITASIKIDSAAVASLSAGANPTEVGGGYYEFDPTQAETNGKEILVMPSSSTTGVNVIGAPALIKTDTPNLSNLGVESDGDLTKVNTCETNTDMVDVSGLSTFDNDTETVDIGKVNGTTVGGSGTAADPWGPL